MIHNVIPQGTVGAGAAASGSLAQQDVNGLIITAAGAATLTWHANDYLTVTLKSPMHPQEVLVNRVPLVALAHISDNENGMSIGMQDVLAGLTTTDFSTIALAVPLGCLKNIGTDSEIEVLVESGASKTLSVSAYFNQDGPDHMIKHLETTVLRDNASGVEALYLFRNAALVDWSSAVSSVLLKGPAGTTVCNQMDAAGYSAVFGEIEAEGPRRIVKVYQAQDGVTDTIYWQVTGTDASNFTVITRSKEYVMQRVSAGTIYSGNRLIQRLESKSPEERKALRRAGLVPKISVIRSKVASSNLGGYKSSRVV